MKGLNANKGFQSPAKGFLIGKGFLRPEKGFNGSKLNPSPEIPDGSLQFEDSENYLQFEDSTKYLVFETV